MLNSNLLKSFFEYLITTEPGTMRTFRNGETYMNVTGMIIENVVTCERYFKGLDF